MHLVLLVLAATADCLAACVALGADGIRVPLRPALVIGAVSCLIFSLSLAVSALLRDALPEALFRGIGFAVFLSVGLFFLFNEVIRRCLRRRVSRSGKISFGFEEIRCVVRIYLDESRADLDASRHLSSREALLFTLSVSADQFLIGIGAESGLLPDLAACGGIFLAGAAAALCGNRLGLRLKKKIPGSLSWLTGILFLALAIRQLF